MPRKTHQLERYKKINQMTDRKITLKAWLWRWWPSMLTFALVLWLTLAPDPVPEDTIPVFPGADKIVHAIMMGGLTGVLIFDYKRATTARGEKIPVRAVVVICGIVLLFSIFDEFAQTFMALGRSGDVWDFVADAVGVCLAGFAAMPVVNWLFRKRRGRQP